ncbi:MAG: CHRD domain-containing protein [Bacteroidota bacterium]
MKKLTHVKTVFFLVLALSFLVGCSKQKEDLDVIYIVRGNAEAQVSASDNSVAFGNIYGGYSATYKKLAFNINWQNLESAPTGSEFYLVSAFGDVSLVKKFAVTEGNFNGLTAGEIYLNDEQAASLLNGNWYYTVTTIDHPEGEIKGKVTVVKTQ